MSLNDDPQSRHIACALFPFEDSPLVDEATWRGVGSEIMISAWHFGQRVRFPRLFLGALNCFFQPHVHYSETRTCSPEALPATCGFLDSLFPLAALGWCNNSPIALHTLPSWLTKASCEIFPSLKNFFTCSDDRGLETLSPIRTSHRLDMIAPFVFTFERHKVIQAASLHDIEPDA